MQGESGGTGPRLLRVSDWQRFDPVAMGLAAFAAAALASVAYVLVVGREQTLILDEWSYLTNSTGWSLEDLLRPHNDHLIVLPILLLKLMYEVFGISSHLPYQLLAVLLNVLNAGLLYLFARRRVGPLLALAPAVLILFYGAGWDAFVTGYQIPNLIGMAAGLGALLAVERGDRRGDLLTAALLAASLASFTVSVAFAAGILVALLLRGRREAIRSSWIVLAPGILYAGWFLWARKFSETDVTAYNVGSVFSGMMDQLSAVLAGITGLFTTPGSTELATMISVRSDWGPALVAAMVIVAALAFRRRPPNPWLWVVLTILVIYFAMVALNLTEGRGPAHARYVYLGSILTLLVLAEIARGVVATRWWALALAAALALSLLANGATLAAGGRLARLESATNGATLGALEIARGRVPDDFFVEPPEEELMSNPDMFFDAATYFDISGSYGSPALSEAEIEGSTEQARGAADLLLARALPITSESGFRPSPSGGPVELLEPPSEGRAVRRGSCLLVRPQGGLPSRVVVSVPAGGLSYRAQSGVTPTLRLRRFAEAFVVGPSLVSGPARLTVPGDRSSRPWEAEVETATRLEICP
jgi:hypothetical protein